MTKSRRRRFVPWRGSLGALASARCVALVAAVGCAAPAAAPAPPPTDRPRELRDAIVVEGDVGGLNQERVEATFAALESEFSRCVALGTERVPALGGRCTVALRIGTDGVARSAYLKDSTLGDRTTERCILDVVRSRRWPEPVGGEGEAEHALQIDPVAPAGSWKRDPPPATRRAVARAVAPCLRGVRGSFRATLYLRANGSVLAAGVAPPSAAADEKADCIVEKLAGLSFGRQSSRLTKAELTLPY